MHMKGLSLHLVFMLLPMLTGKGRAHHNFILESIAKLIDEGLIEPLIHEEKFRFDQANEAHALFATNKHIGKIVLENTWYSLSGSKIFNYRFYCILPRIEVVLPQEVAGDRIA